MSFVAFNLGLCRALNLVRSRGLVTICGLLLFLTQSSLGEAVITWPAKPTVRSVAAVYKPGVAVDLLGNADGAAFQSFHVEWARGINPVSGWSTVGTALAGGGLNPVTGGTLAVWDTTGITLADYYSIRLRVVETSGTITASTYVYLEPDLFSTNWPRWLDRSPAYSSGLLPARTPTGQTRLVLVNPYINAAQPSQLWQFSADGVSVTTNSVDFGSDLPPAVANLNGAAGDEIVVAELDQVRVFYPNGSTLVLPATHFCNFQGSLVTLADLDGDNQLEVVALGDDLINDDAWLFAWKTNGQMFNGNYPLQIPDANLDLLFAQRSGRVLPVDVNMDGIPELLVIGGDSSDSFSLRMFNADGSPTGWPITTLNGEFFQVVAGDLTGDGLPEIILAYHNAGANRLSVYSGEGTVIPGWPQQVSGGVPMHALVADLNRDGTNEIIVTAFSNLSVLKPDGTQFPGSWPVQGSGFQAFGVPCVADIDGNGIAEILICQNNTVFSSPLFDEVTLLAYRTNASIARSWRLLGANGNEPWQYGAPLIGDFDSDGQVDIAVNYNVGNSGKQGVVTVLGLDAPYRPDRRDWPMYFHDPRNSAVGFTPAKLSLTNSAGNLTLSWPLQPDPIAVESTTNLTAGSWLPFLDAASLSNGQYRVTLPATNSRQLFRLKYP